MIERLEEDRRIQVAGMIGRYFRIDPVSVLDSDYTTWAIRIASYNVASREEAAALAKAKASKGKTNA